MLMHLGTFYRKEHDLAADALILTEGFTEKKMSASGLHAISIPFDFAQGRPLEMNRCMAYLVLVFFFLFSFFISHAQQPENEKIRFLAKIETRNTFFQTHHVTMLGVRAGFEFKFPVRCGLGYYWTLTNIDSKLYKPSDHGLTDPIAQPRMRYAFGYIDYSFYDEDDWTLSVPIQIGVGETYYKGSEGDHFANGLIVPMEAGVAVDYLFNRWVGFGVGLGYRVLLKGNKQVKENFNSPYYQIRLNILFTEIFRGIKARKKKAP